MGMSSHPHTLPILCLGKEPLGPIHHGTVCSQKSVLMSTEQRYALKDIINCTVLLQDILHICQVQSMGSNLGGGGAVLLISVTYS